MNEWISVEDRLPEDDIYVIGYADEWGHFLGWRENGYWKTGPYGADGSYIALVTHWAHILGIPS